MSQVSPLSSFHITPSLTGIVFLTYHWFQPRWSRGKEKKKKSHQNTRQHSCFIFLKDTHFFCAYSFLSRHLLPLSALCQRAACKQNIFLLALFLSVFSMLIFFLQASPKRKSLSQQASVGECCLTRRHNTLALLSKPGVASKHCCSVIGSVYPVPTVLPECLVFPG